MKRFNVVILRAQCPIQYVHYDRFVQFFQYKAKKLLANPIPRGIEAFVDTAYYFTKNYNSEFMHRVFRRMEADKRGTVEVLRKLKAQKEDDQRRISRLYQLSADDQKANNHVHFLRNYAEIHRCDCCGKQA